MSARQNKKQRKGRNSANNRERTVTTLTEDPNTPYLVPTPSEEPPGGHLSTHLGNKAPIGSQPYQLSNFGGFQGYPATFNPQQQPYFPPSQSQTMQQQSSPQYKPSPPLPFGKNDLEILQNLKQLILDNQHPIFRATPQPTALAQLYQGPLPAQPQAGVDSGDKSSLGLVPAIPDPGRLGTGRPSKDTSSTAQQDNSSDAYHNSSGNNVTSNTNALAHRVGKPVSGSSGSHSVVPEFRSPVLAGSTDDHEGRYEYSTRSHAQSDSAPLSDRISNGIKKQSLDDPMDGSEAHGSKGNVSRSDSWTSKQHSESMRPDSDRTSTSRGGATPISAGQADTRSISFNPPGEVRDRDRGAAPGAHGWSWQDRTHRRPDYDRPPPHGRQQNYHRLRRVSSASDHHRPMVNNPPIRRGGPVVESPQSHIPVSSGASSTDVMRRSDAPDLPIHGSNESVVVSTKHSVDYHPDARVPPLSSRIEGIEPDTAPSTRPNDSANSRAALPAPSGPALPDAPVQDPGHPTSRQSANDTGGPPSRSNSRPSPHGFNKKKFQKYPLHSAGPNTLAATYNSPASDHPTPRSVPGRPPSPSLPPSGTSRPPNPRSSSVDGRRGRFPSPLGPRWDHRGRDMSRDRPPPGYRGDYDPDLNPTRYSDRSYGRDYSPPPSHGPPFPPGERGPPGTYPSPSSSIPPGRDWGSYPASYAPGDRRDWNGGEEETYNKSRTWEGRPPPPPPSERDRYDYPPPPRSSNWVERDYPARDSYPPGPPPPPADDRYNDRGRLPHSVYPPYNRVTRPRSPSPPLRRGGPDSIEDRPPVKRPREEYDPVDYYPPPPTNRRGGHPPGEYSHPPPRTGSPGPSGPSWAPTPPTSGSSGGPSGTADRDFRYPPPVSGGYDRQRSPGAPRGRPPFSRGGYGGRNAYPPRP